MHDVEVKTLALYNPAQTRAERNKNEAKKILWKNEMMCYNVV